MVAPDINQLANGLVTPDPRFAEAFRALLRELTKGLPVPHMAPAGALRWPVEKVATVLAPAPGIECDAAGNITGYGLTLRETAHLFVVEGRRLHTWCAFDTLMIPVLLRTAAHVRSRCPATGQVIALTVTPQVVEYVELAEPVMSFRRVEPATDIRAAFLLPRAFLRLGIGRHHLVLAASGDRNPPSGARMILAGSSSAIGRHRIKRSQAEQ